MKTVRQRVSTSACYFDLLLVYIYNRVNFFLLVIFTSYIHACAKLGFLLQVSE